MLIKNVKRDSQTRTLAATTHNVTLIILIVSVDCPQSELYLLAHLVCLFSSSTPLDLHNILTDTELPMATDVTQTPPPSIFRSRTSKSLVLFVTEFDLWVRDNTEDSSQEESDNSGQSWLDVSQMD
ncbi:hypothetical protein N7455_006275 [Penicillium solitum]|uniref:uncharacterized protein n=1 Tax=Penicillium solitum TaxID=60172 RepID=UPI0017A7FCC7|nr:hypothetical protein HAV15_011771 [Penicillium sp. str. \